MRGTVFDSIAGRPLAGASFQIVRADSGHVHERFAASTDSAGAFTVSGVPAGRYLAGFYHPAVDSLGFQLPDRMFDVASGASTIALATPSPSTVIRTICGVQSVGSPDAINPTLLFGHVRDARTETDVVNANVTVTWADVEQTEKGLGIVDRAGRTTTHRGGVFALCGVPVDVSLAVRLVRATDSVVIGARVPPSGVLHLTLAMGAAGTTGRIVGHVVDRAKRSVAAAHVSAGDREATVNDAGSFTLDGVPTGSQTIDVRAIGYAPVSLLVNVAEGRPTNVEVALERVVALPGMVSRDSVASTHLAQFLADKRSDAVGSRFVEQTRIPGYKASLTACQLVSKASGSNYCASPHYCPATVVNGTWTLLRMDDLDADDIIGIEYFENMVPLKYEGEFQKRPRACPLIVWTRCPGSTIPTCGDNPASKPIDRPKLPPTRGLSYACSTRCTPSESTSRSLSRRR